MMEGLYHGKQYRQCEPENGAPAGKKGLPAYIILGIIALVAAVALAVTNMITKGPIQERADAALREAFNAVMPAESYEAITIPSGYEVSSLYAAKNGDEVVGYCVTASANGYNGPVAVNLGVGADGPGNGLRRGRHQLCRNPRLWRPGQGSILPGPVCWH